METCRDRFGKFQSTVFNFYACAMCFHYLFDSHGQHYPIPRKNSFLKKMEPLNLGINSQNSTWPYWTYMDLMNSSVVRMVCSTLKDADCKRWNDCCAAARQCCTNQMTSAVLDSDTPFCPKTWDGFSCVNDTMAGATAYFQCPSYITGHTSEAELARKYCTENGSWYKDEIKGQEWTDYTPCVQLENYRLLFHVTMSCHAISLALTVPASLIFLAFRQLRRQHRIQIHLNMFLSSMMTNIIWMMWENLVYGDRLEKAENTLMHRDMVGFMCTCLSTNGRDANL